MFATRSAYRYQNSEKRSTLTVVQRSALLDLPAEVLTHILSFLLVHEEGTPIVLRPASERRWRNEIRELVAIDESVRPKHIEEYNEIVKNVGTAGKSRLLRYLLVCHDFYFAGVAAYYGGSIFKFRDAAHLAQMVSKLDVDRRRHLSKVMVSRDIMGDLGEEIEPGEWTEAHDLATLRGAVDRLPAIKHIILDFRMGGGAPPFIWGDLLRHTRALRREPDPLSSLLRFSVDGKVTDPEDWAVAGKKKT